jgi:hypothetical protein
MLLSVVIGAKMGNGILVILLGTLVLSNQGQIGSRNSSSAWR